MPAFKSSVSIEQPADAVFDFVRDVRNLPRYFDGLTAADPTDGDQVRVTAEEDGRSTVSEAWFRVHDGHRRRIEWGSASPDEYHGWLEVDPEGAVCSVTVEIHATPDGDRSVDERLDRTLYTLKSLLEPG
ncbi:MAG: SRPBCC family protein [Acidimicrobiales bacterium]